MRRSTILVRLVAVLVFASTVFASTVAASESPSVFPIRAGERIVHLVGAPFTDAPYAPRLEAWLLRDFAGRGLSYRRVSGSIGQVIPELENRILIHLPTTVIIQTGNWELLRERHYDFSKYGRQVTELLGKLAARQVRVILCSPVPVRVTDPKGELQFIAEGLARWVGVAREIARRAGVAYIDLYTAAVDWPMVGPNKLLSHYDAVRHEQSFELLRRQIRFVPEGSAGGIDARDASAFKNLAALKTELDRGQVLAGPLADIAAFAAPIWLRADNVEAQRTAARRRAESELAQHDTRVREILGVAGTTDSPPSRSSLSQHRAIFKLPSSNADEPSPRVVKLPIDFRTLMKTARDPAAFDQHTVRIVTVDGARPGEVLPFRFEHRWHEETKTFGENGTRAFTVADLTVTQVAVHFSSGSGTPAIQATPTIGDGDLLRLAGDGRTSFSAPAAYPWSVDFDGDGRRDLIGSDR